uniref:Coiled-coil-helix-coiled-coil-helix domain-containing protein 7 n=1 Tax=Bos indicus x Bos taurus TaxID=30522 RepID=A0A4W2I4Y7_BOBOX
EAGRGAGGAAGRGRRRGREHRPAHSSRLGPPPAGWGRGEARPPPPSRAPFGCQSGGGARSLGRRPPRSGGSTLGCALLKAQLREPLTCLELETAWTLAERPPEESDASTRCMAENNYDKESCSSHFLKYKNCRKFWNSVMIQRRQNGVKPPMPTAAERDEILGGLGKMPY